MNKIIATSVIAGGLVSAAGVAMAVSDRKTRKRIAKTGSKAMKKASQAVGLMNDLRV